MSPRLGSFTIGGTLSVVAALSGCSSTTKSEDAGCTPRGVEACLCPDGSASVRECGVDRSFGPCLCGAGGGGGGDGGESPVGGSSTGGRSTTSGGAGASGGEGSGAGPSDAGAAGRAAGGAGGDVASGGV
ncbi:MAG TPA: hypothetical protein PLU22_27920, partial [Polyangiaceae bacterium]|nr:hypothetical protein [Polyangiaceae bacterium]